MTPVRATNLQVHAVPVSRLLIDSIDGTLPPQAGARQQLKRGFWA